MCVYVYVDVDVCVCVYVCILYIANCIHNFVYIKRINARVWSMDLLEPEPVDNSKFNTQDDANNPSICKLDSNKRYILFVGSLPYKATEADIKKHFADTPISVRIRVDKQTGKPKGFAFVEFDNRQDLEFALEKHHSKLMGRKINVELTAGGGGKSANRQARIKERNERLATERQGKNLKVKE